jgi:P-aminobenzoate N-oxygenase AurF.
MTSVTSTGELADRERLAARLLGASAEHSFDPMVEVDWDAPLVDGMFFAPPHRLTLYGTDLWTAMSHHQRVELSRHEVASIASVGIWFELVLMQLLLRHAYDLEPTSRHVQYALTEIGDECRHSVMFGRMIEKLGCPAYGPGRYEHELGRLIKTATSGASMFAAILIAEEILDALQREAMADENIQPLVRTVTRIHVVEESRHVRYAREELVRQLAHTSRSALAVTRLFVARSAYIIGTRLVHPDVYPAVGLDRGLARAAARANQQYRATLCWAARRLVPFFDEVGLLGGPGMVLWRRAGLVGQQADRCTDITRLPDHRPG